MRLVLADKDPYDLEAMAADLASASVEITTAVDGREVLRLAKELSPHAIVAASSLRQMGGFAISRELKMLADLPGAQPAPKIAVLLERAADAWLAGWSRCDAYRTKPLTGEQLRELLAELAPVKL